MKHAVIYDRASSIHQKDNWSRQDAETTGAELARRYGFDIWELRQEIASGEELRNRPVMQTILEEIHRGTIQGLIVQNFSRLSRDTDGIDGRIIRRVCMDHGCVVITPEKLYDFSRGTDKKQSDLDLMIASWYKEEMLKFMMQGKRARALLGGYQGGPPPTGYKVVAFINDNGKPDSDLEIDQEYHPAVVAMFETYIRLESFRQAAIEINKAGYKLPNGKLVPRTLTRIIRNPIYAGFYKWGKQKKSKLLKDFEPTSIYRPELQIVELATWERANQIASSRKRDRPSAGKWATHPFTGLIACPFCGQPMSGRMKHQKRVPEYFCLTRWNYGQDCPGKAYSGRLLAQAIIPLTAHILTSQLGLDQALEEAAREFGKTRTDNEVEAGIRAEIVQTQEQKARIVKAIAAGIISDGEARTELDGLREKEERLNRRLAALQQTEAIRQDYLQAVEALRGSDIEQKLWETLEYNSGILRKILRIIFEPGSIQVRMTGNSSAKTCEIIAYAFTEEFKVFIQDTMCDNSYVNGPLPGREPGRAAGF